MHARTKSVKLNNGLGYLKQKRTPPSAVLSECGAFQQTVSACFARWWHIFALIFLFFFFVVVVLFTENLPRVVMRCLDSRRDVFFNACGRITHYGAVARGGGGGGWWEAVILAVMTDAVFACINIPQTRTPSIGFA